MIARSTKPCWVTISRLSTKVKQAANSIVSLCQTRPGPSPSTGTATAHCIRYICVRVSIHVKFQSQFQTESIFEPTNCERMSGHKTHCCALWCRVILFFCAYSQQTRAKLPAKRKRCFETNFQVKWFTKASSIRFPKITDFNHRFRFERPVPAGLTAGQLISVASEIVYKVWKTDHLWGPHDRAFVISGANHKCTVEPMDGHRQRRKFWSSLLRRGRYCFDDWLEKLVKVVRLLRCDEQPTQYRKNDRIRILNGECIMGLNTDQESVTKMILTYSPLGY